MLISLAYAQDGGGDGGGAFVQLLPLILIFVVFWLLLIRPQQKKMKLHRGMVAALPYVNDFLPVHNLESLEQLLTALSW